MSCKNSPSSKCEIERTCCCYISALEPSEDCPIHGFIIENKCSYCGKFFKIQEKKD